MEDIKKFDDWMFKIKNKYYFDFEKMNVAYYKITNKSE
jgi:hypothetical protein